MKNKAVTIAIFLLVGLTGISAFGAAGLYDVREYGAKADGKTLCTEAIQKAIDQCARDEGGTVHLTGGAFLSGTIYIKSGVTLRIDPGSTLLGSADLKHYPPTVPAFRSYTDNYTDKSLIYGENLQRVAITGGGLTGDVADIVNKLIGALGGINSATVPETVENQMKSASVLISDSQN
jgi:polygalacturonase